MMKTYILVLLLLVFFAAGCSSGDAENVVLPTRYITEIPSDTPIPTMRQAQAPTLPPSATPTVTPTITPTTTVTIAATVTPTATPVCPAILEAAYTNFVQFCSQTGPNQICNVHGRVDAPLITGVLGLTQAGEMVNLAEVQTLYTMPYDERDGLWGMAYIKSNPVENASILVYGDLTLTFGQNYAINFNSSFNTTPPCENLPATGLLIQTDRETQYVINGTDIIANAITLIQLVDEYMVIMSISGTTTVGALGATKVIPAGTFSRVRIQENVPVIPPEAAQPYTDDMLLALPDARFFGNATIATSNSGTQRIGPAVSENSRETLRFEAASLPRLVIPTPEPVVSPLNTIGELTIDTITERSFHAQLKTTYTVSSAANTTLARQEFIWFDSTFSDFGNGLWNDPDGNSLIFTDACTITTGTIKVAGIPFTSHYPQSSGTVLPASSFIDAWTALQCGDIQPE